MRVLRGLRRATGERLRSTVGLAAIVIGLGAGCSGAPGRGGGADATNAGGSASPGAAPDGSGGWQHLATMDWQIAPGAEEFRWLDFTVDRDHWIAGFRPISPAGTHHVILYGPGALLNELFVSVVGTGPFLFPPDVRMRITKNEKMSIQVHVLDASPRSLGGTSGVDILDDPSPPAGAREANILNVNLPALTLPPGSTTTLRATCTFPSDMTLLAFAPHMHSLGTHYRATYQHGDAATVLYDEPFQVDGGSFVPLPTMAAQKGDQLLIDCTWVNTTAAVVKFGGAAADEMCAAIVLRSPAGDSDFCSN